MATILKIVTFALFFVILIYYCFMGFVYQSFRWMAGAWIICLFLIPGKVEAQQFLYADTSNFIEIIVPGIPFSMLEVSATGGTIEKTKRTRPAYPSSRNTMGNTLVKSVTVECWIARPAQVLSINGKRPEFKISVGVKIGDSIKVFATKKYDVKTVYYLDIEKESHILTEENVMKDDIILTNNNMGNVFNLIFYTPNGQSVTPPANHPKGHLSEAEKKVLRSMKSGGKMYIKFSSFSNTVELIRE